MQSRYTLWSLFFTVALTEYAPLLLPAQAIKARNISALDDSDRMICTTWSTMTMPVTDDCLHALSKVPRSQDELPFYQGEGGLPIEFSNGKCLITIFYKRPYPTKPELSSWLDITISATQLMAGCVKGSTSGMRVGGEMTLREDSKIWIEIRKPYKQSAADSANNTTLDDVRAHGSDESLVSEVV